MTTRFRPSPWYINPRPRPDVAAMLKCLALLAAAHLIAGCDRVTAPKPTHGPGCNVTLHIPYDTLGERGILHIGPIHYQICPTIEYDPA